MSAVASEPEIWRQIPAWPLYEASTLGRVRRSTPSKGTRPGRVLKPQPSTSGYLHVCLSRGDARPVSLTVHRLVCLTFHGEPTTAAMQAAHRNGRKADNRSANLYWATPKGNQADRRQHGTDHQGERHPSAKLTEGDVRTIRADQFSTQAALAARFGVRRSTISAVQRGTIWSHVQ